MQNYKKVQGERWWGKPNVENWILQKEAATYDMREKNSFFKNTGSDLVK